MAPFDVHPVHNFTGHRGSVYVLSDAGEENAFYSSGSDGNLVRWDLDHPDRGLAIATMDDAVFSLCRDPSTNFFYAGTQKGFVYQIRSGEERNARKIVFHKNSVHSLLLLDQILYTFAADGIMAIWEADTMKLIKAIQISPYKIRSAIKPANLSCMLISDGAGRIFSYDIPGGEIKLILQIEGIRSVFSMLYISDQDLLWIGGMDALIHRYRLAAGVQKSEQTQAHWYTVNSLVDLEPLPMVASASRDKSIRIWNKNDFSLLKDISPSKPGAHRHSVNALLWKAEQRLLLSASDDGSIKSWKLQQKNDTD